ncbi:MAG: putative SOS response-associated peptidase YedK [Planctomycetota bacterium]|jgi:putative SOS response-associated peptidase YedK
MCGRFTLQNPSDVLADLFELDEVPELIPRFNIAPTQMVAAIRNGMSDEPRELAMLRWGLIPFFAKDMKIGARMINSRSETASSKPSFRTAFKRRRCLIPADGFYEWRKAGTEKFPFHIHMAENKVFAMAGLYERWQSPDGNTVESCTVLTTEPNDVMKSIHDRMPVILAPEDWDLWLDNGIESADLIQPLLAPWEGEPLIPDAVSKFVNNARNEGPSCLDRLTD